MELSMKFRKCLLSLLGVSMLYGCVKPVEKTETVTKEIISVPSLHETAEPVPEEETAEEEGTLGHAAVEAVLDEADSSRVVFTARENIADFRILSIQFAGADEDILFEITREEPHGNLNRGESFATSMMFEGTIPSNAISFTDLEGNTHRMAVSLSGFDGSVELSPFRIAGKSAVELSFDGESDSWVTFLVSEDITEFTILKLHSEPAESGFRFVGEAIESYGDLAEGDKVGYEFVFAGDLPEHGFSYVDGEGKEHRFVIGLSGFDGSLDVMEME